MKDFTAACQQQWGATATATIARNEKEPPSFWVKCLIHRENMGGISLDKYCSTVKPGTQSYNPKKYDYTATNDGWLLWQCVPA